MIRGWRDKTRQVESQLRTRQDETARNGTKRDETRRDATRRVETRRDETRRAQQRRRNRPRSGPEDAGLSEGDVHVQHMTPRQTAATVFLKATSMAGWRSRGATNVSSPRKTKVVSGSVSRGRTGCGIRVSSSHMNTSSAFSAYMAGKATAMYAPAARDRGEHKAESTGLKRIRYG